MVVPADPLRPSEADQASDSSFSMDFETSLNSVITSVWSAGPNSGSRPTGTWGRHNLVGDRAVDIDLQRSGLRSYLLRIAGWNQFEVGEVADARDQENQQSQDNLDFQASTGTLRFF